MPRRGAGRGAPPGEAPRRESRGSFALSHARRRQYRVNRLCRLCANPLPGHRRPGVAAGGPMPGKRTLLEHLFCGGGVTRRSIYPAVADPELGNLPCPHREPGKSSCLYHLPGSQLTLLSSAPITYPAFLCSQTYPAFDPPARFTLRCSQDLPGARPYYYLPGFRVRPCISRPRIELPRHHAGTKRRKFQKKKKRKKKNRKKENARRNRPANTTYPALRFPLRPSRGPRPPETGLLSPGQLLRGSFAWAPWLRGLNRPASPQQRPASPTGGIGEVYAARHLAPAYIPRWPSHRFKPVYAP